MNINDTLQFQNAGLPDDILRRKLWGDFEGAIRLIDRRLADPATPKALAYSIQIQKEMMRYLPDCRFYNCSHTHEPGCAVVEAVKRGEIAYPRYESYLKIMDEDDKYRK